LLTLEIGPGNLPIRRTLASGDEHTLNYDESGRCRVAATKKDTIAFEYDAWGNCVVEKRNGLGVEHQFRGLWRSPAESVLFGRFAIHYDRRRVEGSVVITDPGGIRHHIRCGPHGIAERRFSNGSQEIAQYDGVGRCLLKALRRSGGALWTRRYEWSGEGELRRVDDSAEGVFQHEYDAGHRLRRRILPGGRVEHYEMDAANNLLRQPGLDEVTLQEGNRLLTANGLSVTYDDRNHIAERQSVNGPVHYTYDSRDQLTRVDSPAGEWHAEYDAMRRRTRTIYAGQTTEYYWNQDQVIAEVDARGRARVYVYADALALTPLLFLDYESLDSPPASCRRYFIFTDQIGTPRLVEDESGQEVWSARIEPFGRAHVSPDAKIEFNLRFPGHYYEPAVGLHYNRFRDYDPALGRYLQSDPWGIGGGYNLYAYRLNPLLHVDVRGLGDDNDPDCQPKTDQETPAVPPPRTGGDYDANGLPMTGLGKKTDAKVGPHGEQTQIFTPEQREQFRVVAGPNGELIYPNQGNRPVHSPGGQAIYVMDKNGNVYVHEAPSYRSIHHSSLAAGEEPVAAGHVAQIGEPPGPAPPFQMNNGSGHYNPSNDDTVRARDELASQGVDTSGTRIEDVTTGQVQHPPGAPPAAPAPAPDATGPTRPDTPSALGKR
jgi:RHS repeat-associated protein